MDVWQWYVRRGRISRLTCVLQYLVVGALASVAASRVDAAYDLPLVAVVTRDGRLLGEPAGLLEILVTLALVVPYVSAVVARLHDCGKSAWWLLLSLIPIAGGLVLTVAVLFFRGDRTPNAYGPPPAPFRRPRLPVRPRPAAHTAEEQPLQPQGR